ncbi:MAG: Abi family protein [Catenibacterium mitsuokai]|nr:Abi family protein [Catenibacterium mitsuokai]
MPIWAILESLTLGKFGNFYVCSNVNVKKYISNEILHLPTKFDEDGKITEILIYSIKDLRQER